MKTIAKILGIASLALLLTQCKKHPSGSGEMVVKMTDAPGDYLEVNVDIAEVMAHYSTITVGQNGWVALDTDTGIYNLLELQNNITEVIANGNAMPVGDVTQLRLILGPRNTVMTEDSMMHPLQLSSQDITGLKVNLNTTIPASQTVEVILDFDAEQSVIELGNGEYKLKPVIKVKQINAM